MPDTYGKIDASMNTARAALERRDLGPNQDRSLAMDDLIRPVPASVYRCDGLS